MIGVLLVLSKNLIARIQLASGPFSTRNMLETSQQ